jgi:hypothetical protein
VTSCECWLFWFSLLVFKIPFYHFHGTFKCVGVQCVSVVPLACCNDHCKAASCIGTLTSSLFFLVPISKDLGVFVKVLQEVQIYVSFMKTKISKNVLDSDSFQLHRFPFPHKKHVIHIIQQSFSNLM